MRNIPIDNLAYSVFISLDNGGSGSGFLLNAEGKLYLVTAKHVIHDNINLRGKTIEVTCQTKDIEDDSVTKLSIDFMKAVTHIHPTADVAIIEIGSRKELNNKGQYTIESAKGVKNIVTGKSSVVSVNAQESTKLLKDVLISNDVFVYGYPTSLGLRNSPQFDYNKPLLRKGIVSNLYHTQSTIILDCPVYFGNSGGPVVEVEQNGLEFKHMVIGVVSQFIPFVQQWHNPPTGIINTEFLNSGFSVAVSMDKVFELIGFTKK